MVGVLDGIKIPSSSPSSLPKKEEVSDDPFTYEGFEEITEEDVKKRGFVTLLYGDTATGKTFTAFTFQEPIFVIDTENRAINTKQLHKGKKIYVFEPTEIKENVNRSMDDIFDEVASINNLTDFLSSYVKAVNSGKIKGGTLVIDSVTDCWGWCMAYMFDKLSTMRTKKGEARADADMQTVLSQLDWKVATNKHDGIVRILRSLVKKGIFVVFTAREKSVPEYQVGNALAQNKEKIRCQKDIPFSSDLIFNMKKSNGKYIAVCEKCGIRRPPTTPIEELTFDKIKELKPLGE